MSDLANLVLAGVRDKVVQDLKEENEKLSAQNVILSKAVLLQPSSFCRIERRVVSSSALAESSSSEAAAAAVPPAVGGSIAAGAGGSTGAAGLPAASATMTPPPVPPVVIARTQQFPDPQPKCDCCSWYPMAMEQSAIPVAKLHQMELFLGSIPELPISKSTKFTIHQVTGYQSETETTALQISDVASGGTIHVAIGPIPRHMAKTLFAKTPKDLQTFCQRFHDLAPTATVEIVCFSIPNVKAIDLLTNHGGLSVEEARIYLKISTIKQDEGDTSAAAAAASSTTLSSSSGEEDVAPVPVNAERAATKED